MTDGHSTESPKRFFIGDTTHDLRGLDLDLLPDVKYRWHSTHLLSLPGYLQCTRGMAMRFERGCAKLFQHCEKTIGRPRIAAAQNKLVRLPRPALLALTAPIRPNIPAHTILILYRLINLLLGQRRYIADHLNAS